MAEKGSFGIMFDLSFSEFVTTRVIKILFIIGILFSALGALMIIIGGFNSGWVVGILALLLSPLVFLLYVLLARIWCEMIIVIFRIAENTARLVDQGKKTE